MKIAIPIAEGRLCQHFGHCETFALIEADPGIKTILGRKDLDPPPHEPGVLPAWLAGQGATHIIAGGMGQRAQALFAQQGVEVVVGAPPEEPETLVSRFLDGALVSGDNACDH
jgi:predicted Fe-Mo cluster-binding NifX family protein